MKKRFSLLLALVIILLLFFTLRNVNFSEVVSLLKKINLSYLGIAFALNFLAILLWNLRWQNTLKGYIDAKFWFLLKVLFAGTFLNIITPGTGIGGEPAKAYFLKKKYKKPKSKILGYTLADKAFNYASFLIFVIFSFLFMFLFFNIPSKVKVIPQITVLVIFIIAILIIIGWKKANYKIGWIAKKLFRFKSVQKHFKNSSHLERYLKSRINNLKNVLKETLTNKKKIYFGIGISIIYRFLDFLTAYFIFLSFNEHVNFISIIIVISISILLGDLSPTPGGIGIVESSMILLYSAMGISASLATLVALLNRVIYYFYSIVVGGICIIYLRWKQK